MPITIVGAGAIGGIVGAHLIAAGHDIRFVEANREHADAIRINGLTVSGEASLRVHPPVFLPDEIHEPLDEVFLAVKCQHTDAAMRTIAPLLTPAGYVLSLQNGLEEYKIARSVGKERTVGAFLTFGGYYLRPGEVVFSGPGSLRIGEMDGVETPRVRQLAALLSQFHPVEVTDNIFGYLWGKMAVGALYFATALVSADVPDILDASEYRPMLGNLVGEVVAVANALGVACETIDGFDPNAFAGGRADPARQEASWRAQYAYWGDQDDRRTGVWRDLAIHHRPTEVDDILDALRRGGEQGVRLDRVTALIALIKEIEAGERQLGWHNLDELRSLDERISPIMETR